MQDRIQKNEQKKKSEPLQTDERCHAHTGARLVRRVKGNGSNGAFFVHKEI